MAVALAAAAIGVPASESHQAFAQERPRWTPWATPDTQGMVVGPFFAHEGAGIVAIQAKEQPGHGIVNLRVKISSKEGSTWSPWLSCNPDGRETHVLEAPENTHFTGMVVRYQNRRYGIVDFQMMLSNSTSTPWITNNMDGTEQSPSFCQGWADGIEAMERGGAGLVNIHLHCREP